jgi:hypothetical protein
LEGEHDVGCDGNDDGENCDGGDNLQLEKRLTVEDQHLRIFR